MNRSQADTLYAIVLAAGASTRFGGGKQYALVDGRPMLARSVATARILCRERVVTVLGHEWAECHAACKPLGGFFVVNENYEDGLGASLSLGVRALPDTAQAVLILLGDQPLVGASDCERLRDAWDGSETRIAVSRSAVGLSPPIVFPRRYFRALENLSGDRGARQLVEKHRAQVIEVEVKQAAVDVDRPSDLERL